MRTLERTFIPENRVVSQEEWEAEHRAFLEEAKEFTKAYNEFVAKRLSLPWVKVDTNYVFESEKGAVTLGDLFGGRSQLIIQHFMFSPEDKEGCVGCSFSADHVDSARQHFENHDVAFAAVSIAPLSQLLAYKKRMDWNFNWVSSAGSDFNYDYHVSFTPEQLAGGTVYYNFQLGDAFGPELPGTSVFYKGEDGSVYHTQSIYSEDGDLLIGTYNYLAITPKGRNEHGPNGNLMDWVKRHDSYEDAKSGQDAGIDVAGCSSCHPETEKL